MGKSTRGKQDGTGPKQGSYQQKKYGIGKRQQAGKKCPKK